MSSMTSEARLGDRSLSILSFNGYAAEWDSFVATADDSTFCHLAGWREIMADVLGHEVLYAVARDDDGACSGVLPLVRVRSRLFGHYLVSMPFLNYGGPLGSPDAQTALAEHAVEEACRTGADLLELRARHSVPSDLHVSSRKITVLVELRESQEEMWKDRFSGKLRSQIRRPMKEGMEARFGLEQWEAFYEVFARHMRDLGTPVLPRSLFKRVSRLFADSVVFGAVYKDREPVAGGCGFVWRDEFEMTWASALREYKRSAPNMLLYWSFIQRMIERGVRVFNFGRCTPGGGTHRFKRQWGGIDVPLQWLQWSSRGAAATPTPDRPIYQLAALAWRRIPRPVADRLGPVLARCLP